MKFKGTIIITDPCYIMRAKHHGTTPLTENDWEACNYGDNMSALGITHYITENTIYGDWSCSTYVTENPQEVVDKVAEISKYFNDEYDEYDECDNRQDILNFKVEKIGNFCADAGLVSVFLLDEVRKYNPDIDNWIAEHSWCVTTIKDFDGEVEYYVDVAGDAHIIGTGSTNFFTTQTGL